MDLSFLRFLGWNYKIEMKKINSFQFEMEETNWKKLAIEEFGISEQLFDREKFLTEKERYYHLKSHFSLIDYAELGLPQYASPIKQMKFAIENLDFETFVSLWKKFPSAAPLLTGKSISHFSFLNSDDELPPALMLARYALEHENLPVYRFLECSEYALRHYFTSTPEELSSPEPGETSRRSFHYWKQVHLGGIEEIEELFSPSGQATQFFESKKSEEKSRLEFARICIDLVRSRFIRKVQLGLNLFENSFLFDDYSASGVILAYILSSPFPNKFTSDLIEEIPNNIYQRRIADYLHRESVRNSSEDLDDDDDYSDIHVEKYLSQALLSGRRELISALVKEGLKFNSSDIWYEFLLSNQNLLKKIELVEEFLPQASRDSYRVTGFGRCCETTLTQEISDFGVSAATTGNLDLMRIAVDRIGFDLYDPISFFIDEVLLNGHYLEARAIYLWTDNKECQDYSRTLLLSREYEEIPKSLFE